MMKTGKKLLTGTLLALCAALLVLCIVLAAGWSKTEKTNVALPVVRNNGTAIQWKYSDEADWCDLVALTELRGAAGENGKDGADGKDGHTPTVSVRLDSDGVYYWTIDGEWLLDGSGKKIRAQGADGKDDFPKSLRYNGRNESDKDEDDARMQCITQCGHLLRAYSSSRDAAGAAP